MLNSYPSMERNIPLGKPSFRALALVFFCMALPLFFEGVAMAQQSPPIVDATAERAARQIAEMPDTDPSLRLAQLLASEELSDGALFALAETHPSLVEQLVAHRYQLALNYIRSLPPADVHRIRRGETVIRTSAVLRGTERNRAIALAEHFDFRRFDPSRIEAIRVGPLEGRVIRVEVTVRQNRRSQVYDSLELAWTSTPERDEESRNFLTRHFGARPSMRSTVSGRDLRLRDGSFEAPETIGVQWGTVDAIVLGNAPVGEIALDQTIAADGQSSIRFYADERTRRFRDVFQVVEVSPGDTVRARALHKAQNLRVEFEQDAEDVHISLIFLDVDGLPIGDPSVRAGRLATHSWEVIELSDTAPEDAQYVQLSLRSAVSGRSWFDAVTLTLEQ